MNRIISKEKEREDIQGEILQSSSTVVFPHSTKKSNIPTRTTRNPTSFQSSRAKKTILHTELILLHEIFKKYYNYKAHPVHTDTRHLPATVPRVSKHSTRQNKAPGSPTSIPGPYSTSRLPVNSTR